MLTGNGLAGQITGSPPLFTNVAMPVSTQLVGGTAANTFSTQLVGGTAASSGYPTGSGHTSGDFGILGGAVTDTTVAQAAAQQAAVAASLQGVQNLNPIVLENMKPGNPESEWGIDGAGDSNIEGFATDISVNHGSPISFKINTNSTDYRIDIYRLGYYGGLGARKVDTIEHTGLQTQPDPLVDPTTGLVDAGNWSVSATWNVPADAVSGVYIAKLTRLDGTAGENQIPFIVRDDSSTSDIVFQTSDETWQAYNGWGIANFYGGEGPATGQGGGRAYEVSYNRPIDTRGGIGTAAGPQDYLFGAEYSSISWLEENGYDVSYMSGIDVDRYGSLLLNHKVFVDSGHDEYWTENQRNNVQAARDAGVNLEFWSGNEMYWETRLAPSISSGQTDDRTLVSYKETWANEDIDPSSQWTGTFRDPRFPSQTGAGTPENSLTGQLFTVDDTRSTIGLKSITVPYDDANLRFWRNTSVANLQPGQTATLTQNYLGYEWDTTPDNGFDPAGLVQLSSTTLDVNSYLLDYGNTTGNGTATHSLSLYRAPSGALVFGAGTVYWSWGLSDNHDLEATPTDSRVQQAMVNLFADMGVQPQTLQSGLIKGTPSTDHTPPVSTIKPIGNVNAGSVVTVSGTASDVGGVIAGVEVSTDGGASWHPATGDENWTYSWSPQVPGPVTVQSRAVDDSINLETPSAGQTVTVGAFPYLTVFPGSDIPAVVNTTDASAVELGLQFSSSVAGTVTGVRFYKSSQDIGVHTGELWSSTGTLLATVTFSNETASGWQSASFSSPVTITPGQTYTVSYHTNTGHYSNTDEFFTSPVKSGPLTAAAGVFAYSTTSQFPTGTYNSSNFWVDVMFNPAAGVTNHAPTAVADTGLTGAQNAAVVIAASQLLANDSDLDGDILSITSVSAASHGTVALTAQSNPQNSIITFTPDAGYTGAASFSYTIADGRGGTSTAQVSLTIQAAGSASYSLFSIANIPAGTGNDNIPVELGVKFTATAAGQVTALKFYRSASDTGPDVLDLWSATGTNLASVTFTNTSASGWQTVALSTPVRISANTTYVVSYHTTGAYVATANYFTSAVNSGPLSAIAASNGVYTYGGTSTAGVFPSGTFNASNYWADVAFTPLGGSNTAPTAVADTGSATEKGGVANGIAGSTATGNVLTNDTDPDAGDTKTVTAVNFGATAGVLGTSLTGAHGGLLLNADGTYTYTINETDAAVQALRLPTDTLTDTFNYTMSDAAGATSSTTLTVTIHGANDAPVLAAQTAQQSAVIGQAYSFTLPTGTFTDVDSGDSLTYVATDSTGAALPSWLSFNATTRAFTGTPSAANAGTVAVKVTATDAAGLSASEIFNLNVSTQTYSLFSASTPATAPGSFDDGQPLELGVKFTSSAVGQVTALKFYRSASDNGPDVLDLWSATGTKLASVTFSNTSASGWQTVALATPVTISANTTYVVSYHTTGAYVATANYFTSAVTGGPLTAIAASNGVYTYGGTSTAGVFPSSSWSASNYWADVVFATATTTTTNTAPTAVADTGSATEKGGVANGIAGSAATGNVLTNDTDPDAGDIKIVTAVNFGATAGVLGTSLTGAHGGLVLNADGTYTYTINETDAAVQALRLPTNTLTDTFNYTMSDAAGATSSTTLTVTIHGANDAPVLAVQTSAQSAVVGQAYSFTLPTGTFTDVDSGDSLTYVATDSTGAALPTWLSFNATTHAFTGTPAAADAGTAAVKVTATDAAGLSASETFNLNVSTAASQSFSLFDASTPATAPGSFNDGLPLELGVKFTSSTAGQVTALKFYRSANDNGPDVLDLWSATGTNLASVTFTNTSASGWQTVALATPVTISANTTYVASYHTTGAYVANSNYFTSAATSGPLTAPSGSNGVYAYGGTSTAGLFPSSSFNSANYWADLVFHPAA
ncbi:DUF4082 domain-containing protein [Bradyrhizobium sp. dw_411]|uniref:DUF4082 domain-containing protein n=1 Tax=Bradyrhizobium sp. dw_411 TaxID=2720082 RepID=UPI00201BA212|nr:DUF4082 domain-containing protein [Bradyrhizobium sp. dw_411]